MAHITHILLDMLGAGEISVYDFDESLVPEGQRLTYYTFDPPDLWEIRQTLRPRFFVNTDIDVQFQRLEQWLRRWLAMLPDNESGSLIWSVRATSRFNDGYHFVMAGMTFLLGIEYGWPLEGAEPVSLMVQSCDVGALLDDVHPLVQNAWLAKASTNKESYNEGHAARFKALERSRTLLTECLSPSQREELAADDQFHMRGADGHTYIIKRGFGHNVYRLDADGHPVAEYCIIISDWSIPDYDLMLAQKLLLETNPHEFEAVSNIRILNRIRIV